jgi:RNA polymerase primary sigma factor
MSKRSSAMAWYSSRIRKGAKLSLEEESLLAREAREGSRVALHRLIEDKLALVMKVVGEYRNFGVPFEDLLAEANLGLVEAVRRFDSTKGCKFATYAVWWVRKAVFDARRKHGRLVRISSHRQKRIGEIRDAERRLESRLGRTPSGDEIVAEIPRRRGESDLRLRLEHVELSLDEHIRGADGLRLADRLADPSLTSAEAELIHREGCRLVSDALGELREQERKVITYRFGLDNRPPLTLVEVGRLLGVSRERIRQVEVRAKQRLRRKLARRYAGGRVYSGSDAPSAEQPNAGRAPTRRSDPSDPRPEGPRP